MKIIYLAFARLPTEKAHGLQIMKTCEALAEAGAEVELVIPGRKTVGGDSFEYYKVKKSFILTALGTPDWVKSGFIGFLASLLWFAEAAKLRREFWGADVVYSRDSLVLLQYILLGRKLVYEAHRAPTLVDRVLARRAYRVITITESIKKEFLKAGVREARVVVAHDAVDEITRGAPRGQPLALYAGSRRPGKGIETVEAARPLLPTVTVDVITDKTPPEVHTLLGQADVVIVPNSAKHPSSALHTSPMKLFEALASGARVVASDVPAIREVASEKEVYFFTPDDPQSLASTIRAALDDPAASLKISAALTLAKKYSWRARAENILNVLK